MSTATSSLASPTSNHLISPQSAVSYTPYTNAQRPLASAGLSQILPLPSNALAAEADAPLNLGLDEEEVVWGGESVGLGFGLLSRLKDKTNALLEAIDWDCRLWLVFLLIRTKSGRADNSGAVERRRRTPASRAADTCFAGLI